ncbi:hypothetical protein HRF87_17155 [Bacillus sp. CRN 9]|nr:hypothetical protein [Bacillus sp. CRN 9]
MKAYFAFNSDLAYDLEPLATVARQRKAKVACQGAGGLRTPGPVATIAAM